MEKELFDKTPTAKELAHEQKSLRKEIHSVEGRIADWITDFSGSIYFVYFHTIWFGFWIAANQGLLKPFISPFDPFPYGLLTMIVSLEAIYLATFILIAQNRQELVEEYRELEEEKEEQEQEEDVEEIQKDLDDIKAAIQLITQRVGSVEVKRSTTKTNGK